jgi:hypothetical protein
MAAVQKERGREFETAKRELERNGTEEGRRHLHHTDKNTVIRSAEIEHGSFPDRNECSGNAA